MGNDDFKVLQGQGFHPFNPTKWMKRKREMLLQTSEEETGVKYLHHLIPVQFVGPVLVDHGVPAPEDPALAQPLDEDALLVAVQEDTPLQVPKELPGDLFLAVILDGICRGELHVLQGIWGIQLLTMAGGLTERDPAALGARGGDVAHQPPAIEEVDHHLGVTWEEGTDGHIHHPSGEDKHCQCPNAARVAKFPVSKSPLMKETSSLLEDISSTQPGSNADQQARAPDTEPLPPAFAPHFPAVGRSPHTKGTADPSIPEQSPPPMPGPWDNKQDASLLSVQTLWVLRRARDLPKPEQSLPPRQGAESEPPSATTHTMSPRKAFDGHSLHPSRDTALPE